MAHFVADLVDQFGNPLLNMSSRGGRRISGGVINTRSGLGGVRDKGDATTFLPSVYDDPKDLETMFVESWAAAALIEIPADDMFARFREWVGDADPDKTARMDEVFDTLRIKMRLYDAIRSARLYGTSLFVMMIDGAGSTEDELDINRVSEGALKNVLVFDRYDVVIDSRYEDPMHPKFGEPEIYSIHPRAFGFVLDKKALMRVHESRVIRFDGLQSPTTFGWRADYDESWGLSELIRAQMEVGHVAGLSGVIAHLTQEAEILHVKLVGYNEALMGRSVGADDPSPEQIATDLVVKKSAFGVIISDVTGSVERLSVNVSNLAGLMNQWHELLAAIARIPLTRFLSQQPTGWNNGDASATSWALTILSMQKRFLDDPLKRTLDPIVARSAGLDEAPDFRWLSLIEVSEKDQLEMEKIRVEILGAALDRTALTENEFRERVSGSDVFGDLDELPEDAQADAEMENAIERAKASLLDNPPDANAVMRNGAG